MRSPHKVSIPELRFPGFYESWKEKSLSDYEVEYCGGASLTPADFVEFSDFRVVPKKSIVKGGRLRLSETNPTYCSKEFFENNRNSVVGRKHLITVLRDLVPSAPSIGLIVVNEQNDELLLAQGVYGFVTNKGLEPYFITSLSNKESYRRLMFKLAVGSTQVHLRSSEFFKIRFHFPEIEEQQKIATFLNSIYDKLKKLRRKRELLETYKRGLMQKLFSQEIRFKQDGSDFPDWEETAIGKLGDTFSGLTGKSAQDFGFGKRYVTYKQVFGQSDINLSDCGLVNISDKETQNTLQRGDIVFTTSSEVPHEVGFSSVVVNEVRESVYLNSFCFGLRPYSKEKLVPEFSSYLFRSHEYRKSIFPLAQGSTRYNLSKSSFVKIRLEIPLEKEQKKIAKFLMSMDRKIEAVAKQITQLETFQKGLLQKMFV